jgi:hypothetical protein
MAGYRELLDFAIWMTGSPVWDGDSPGADYFRKTWPSVVKKSLRLTRRRHGHVSGATIGKNADECAMCGSDFRDEVHFRIGEAR